MEKKMKYKNAKETLPQELIEMIQEYVQGEYIYIPIRERNINSDMTEYKLEICKRDEHIYTRYLEGLTNIRLAEMYNLSESSIRRIIGNQRKKYEDMKRKIQEIAKEWVIDGASVKQIYDSAWQINEKFILKVYEDVNMLERNIKIISILDDMDIPVGSIIKTKTNETYVYDNQYYYVLTKRLKGSNIVSLKDNMSLTKEMGRILSKLHIAFKECEKHDDLWNNSLLDEMNGWVRTTISDNGWTYVNEEDFDVIVSKLKKLYDKLPIQLIHRDVHFGNFLFDNGKFSGYIDFDLSQRNIRIFDLCYFVLGLLSEEEKLDISEDEWREIVRNVFEGYEESNMLTYEEKEAVPYVMMCIELLFVAWFIGQGDVKCANDAMRIYELVRKNVNNINL